MIVILIIAVVAVVVTIINTINTFCCCFLLSPHWINQLFTRACICVCSIVVLICVCSIVVLIVFVVEQGLAVNRALQMDQMLRSLSVKVFNFEFEFLFFFLLFVFSSSSFFFFPLFSLFFSFFFALVVSGFKDNFLSSHPRSSSSSPRHVSVIHPTLTWTTGSLTCVSCDLCACVYLYTHTWGILIYCLGLRTFFVFVESAENLTPERWPTSVQDSF